MFRQRRIKSILKLKKKVCARLRDPDLDERGDLLDGLQPGLERLLLLLLLLDVLLVLVVVLELVAAAAAEATLVVTTASALGRVLVG